LITIPAPKAMRSTATLAELTGRRASSTRREPGSVAVMTITAS
jgi:hypothetical protein